MSDLDDALVRSGQAIQSRLDFAELDPVTSNLDLIVQPTEVLERAIGSELHAIARSIHATAVSNKRIGDEPRLGQLRTVQVAECDAGASDEQFPVNSNGNNLALLIEHVHASVGNRSPDRDGVQPVVTRSRWTKWSSR